MNFARSALERLNEREESIALNSVLKSSRGVEFLTSSYLNSAIFNDSHLFSNLKTIVQMLASASSSKLLFY